MENAVKDETVDLSFRGIVESNIMVINISN